MRSLDNDSFETSAMFFGGSVVRALILSRWFMANVVPCHSALIRILNILGTPLKCYDCTLCPEPFDPSAASCRECKLGGKAPNDVPNLFNVDDNVDLDEELVCVTYSIDVLVVNKTGTSRSCVSKTIGGQDVCDYLSTILSPMSKLLNCIVCNTDLCNA
nr:unnamed protein product [Callosobruchus analis]